MSAELSWLNFQKDHPAVTTGFAVLLLIFGFLTFWGVNIPSEQDRELKSVGLVGKACESCSAINKLQESELASLRKTIAEGLTSFALYAQRPWVLGVLVILAGALALSLLHDERYRRLCKEAENVHSLSEEASVLRNQVRDLTMILRTAAQPQHGQRFAEDDIWRSFTSDV